MALLCVRVWEGIVCWTGYFIYPGLPDCFSGLIFSDTRCDWVLSVAIGDSSSCGLCSAYGTLDILPHKGDPLKLNSRMFNSTVSPIINVCTGSGGCLGHIQCGVTPGSTR